MISSEHSKRWKRLLAKSASGRLLKPDAFARLSYFGCIVTRTSAACRALPTL